MVVPDVSAAADGGAVGLGGGFPAPALPSSVEKSTEEGKGIDFVEVKEEKASPFYDGDDGDGGPSLDSSSSGRTTDVEPDEAVKMVSVKEEEDDSTGAIYGLICGEDDVGGGGGGNYNGSPASSSSVVLAKPMEGLHDSGPPPFLKKTFEMVEDTVTDSIVSWSESRDSFIVWDSHEFSKNLLPKYFKHSNFSSFIRQLNTYGFRKIDPDRWEFATEGFQGGKRHLLKNIKRRSRHNKNRNKSPQRGTSGSDWVKAVGLESQLENLKDDQDVLRVEILKLRQQQEDSQNQMTAVEERIRASESKQLQMLIFFSKATRNPGFIQQLLRRRKQRGELEGGDFVKKQRLQLPTHESETVQPIVSDNNTTSVNCRHQAQEQLATMQTELSETLADGIETGSTSKLFEAPMSGDGYCSPIEDHRTNDHVMCEAETGMRGISSVYNLMSEELMEDNSVVGNSTQEEQLDVNDSKFYLELEDLIGKPKAWGGGYVAGIVEHASCF